MSDEFFYSKMVSSPLSVADTLKNSVGFLALPASWDIVVTDIAGSTRAVMNGKYREVNLIAVSCLVSALNIARSLRLQIPFFFGGDGTTILCPSSMTKTLMTALERIQKNAQKNFSLSLRIGSISTQHIFEIGETIHLAKIRVSTGYDQAVSIGNGLLVAEKIIKSRERVEPNVQLSSDNPPLQGLECRWREIAAPMPEGEILSLIVLAKNPGKHANIYGDVLESIESIFGDLKRRTPVSEKHLSLISTFAEIKRELLIKYETIPWIDLLRTIRDVVVASFIFKFHLVTKLFDPTVYKQQLLAATDTLKIDGMLKTTIHGTSAQRKQLIDAITWQNPEA